MRYPTPSRRARRRPPAHAMAFLLGALLLPAPGSCAQEDPAGEVQFSDGETRSGRLFFAPGTTLRVHGPGRLVQVDPATVIEIRFEPASEKMERKWTFPEPGRTRKEYWGEPYPTRELRAVLRLRSGEELRGHLYTVPLYLEDAAGRAEKIVLRAKQRGAEGETLDALVYPSRVRFTGGVSGEGVRRFALPADVQVPRGAEVAALVEGSLLRIEGRPVGEAGACEIGALPGDRLFAACRDGDRVVAGWPEGDEAALRARIEAALADVRDFFDRRELMGVYQAGPDEDVYALFLLWRDDRTTLPGQRNRPWRVGVWRWVAQDDRLLLAGRGYLFRGIGERGALPRVERSAALWRAAHAAPAAAP